MRDIFEQAAPAISAGELMERFGVRAMGALLLVFGLACVLPLPPGATTVFGAPLMPPAPQLTVGSRSPWLPAQIRAQTIAITDLRRVLTRALGWLERAEALSQPRLLFFGAWALAIPLGNMLPAASLSVLSLALIQRDGVLAPAGYMPAALSGGVPVLAANLIARIAVQALEALSFA
ncbi:exopolysaccharide biosynthesis protein [Phenylobacterium sp.]|uniref:exopolysaccharide biosynthesis protein n=1 Tax=Phenylobacterium sp. TaxID=1871053 RepID=UPI002F401333